MVDFYPKPGTALKALRAVTYYAFLFLIVCLLLGPQNAWVLKTPQNLLLELLWLLIMVFVVLTLPVLDKLLRLIAKDLQIIAQMPPRLFIGGAALLFFTLAGFLSLRVFGGIPQITDSHAQYVHAKAFATMNLVLSKHPLSEFFQFHAMGIHGDQWFSVYAPGHIIMLALGHLLGAPWLVNPFMGAMTLVTIFLLVREISGQSVAYIAVALTLISPFILYMSAEYMNHSTCMFFATFFLFAYIRQHRTQELLFAFLAGFCAAYAFITRPQTMLFFAVPVAVHASYCLLTHFSLRWRATLFMWAGILTLLAFYLYYNEAISDSPWRQGNVQPEQYLKPFEDWRDIPWSYHWSRASRYIDLYHSALFGWGVSSLLFALVLFVLRKAPPYSGLLACCFLAQYLSNFINPFMDVLFGPRYLYETAPIIIALTAFCLAQIPGWLSSLRPKWHRENVQGAIFLLVLSLFYTALCDQYPNLYRFYANNYWEGNQHHYKSVMSEIEKPAILFFENYQDFREFFFLLPPGDENPVIVEHDLQALNSKLIDFYPHRHIYFFYDGALHRDPR